MNVGGTAASGRGDRHYVWSCANGVHLRLSPSAYALLTRVERGAAFGEVAAELRARGQDVTVEDVAVAHARLRTRIDAVEARPAPVPGGFLLQLTLLPATVVTRLAGVLAAAYQPAAAAALVSGVAVVLALALPGGLVPSSAGVGDVLLGYGLFLVIVVAHELGHASACARFGARPSRIGFALYWVFPVFFSDVTAAWSLPRRQRVAVDAGGAYFQAVATAGCVVLHHVTGWAPLQVAAVMSVLSIPMVINPFFRFDGYWLLADALDVPDLGRQPRRIAAHAVARLRGRAAEPLPWPRWVVGALVVYALAAVGYWAFVAIVFVPVLAEQVVAYPGRTADLVTALVRGPHGPDGTVVLSWVFATFLVVAAVLLLRRVVPPTLRVLRSVWLSCRCARRRTATPAPTPRAAG